MLKSFLNQFITLVNSSLFTFLGGYFVCIATWPAFALALLENCQLDDDDGMCQLLGATGVKSFTSKVIDLARKSNFLGPLVQGENSLRQATGALLYFF